MLHSSLHEDPASKTKDRPGCSSQTRCRHKRQHIPTILSPTVSSMLVGEAVRTNTCLQFLHHGPGRRPSASHKFLRILSHPTPIPKLSKNCLTIFGYPTRKAVTDTCKKWQKTCLCSLVLDGAGKPVIFKSLLYLLSIIIVLCHVAGPLPKS